MYVEPNPAHEKFLQGLIELIAGMGDEVTPQEMLGIASQFVGQLLAHQDQRIMTLEQTMDMIQANIELGNRAVVDQLTRQALNTVPV